MQRSVNKAHARLYQSTKAFTLAEVLIGSMTLLLVLLPIFLSINQAFWVMDKARDVTAANATVQSLIEQMRIQTYDNICAKYCKTADPVIGQVYTYSSTDFLTDLNPGGTNNDTLNSFTLAGSFISPKTGQLEVEIIVSWKDMIGHNQRHKYYTLISEGGLSDNINKGW